MDARKKRLLYRCTHRGTKESDALLGGFVKAHIESFSAQDMDVLEALLEAPDADVAAWLFGHAPLPMAYTGAVTERLMIYAAGDCASPSSR